MTVRQRPGDEATPSWRQRRAVRWLAVLAYVLAVAGFAAVFWHWVRGKSWDDSLSFAFTVTMSVLGAQFGAALVRRRAARRGDG